MSKSISVRVDDRIYNNVKKYCDNANISISELVSSVFFNEKSVKKLVNQTLDKKSKLAEKDKNKRIADLKKQLAELEEPHGAGDTFY